MISVPSTSVQVTESDKTALERKPLTPWNVVLLDDDYHTFDYVITMLRKLFGHTTEEAYLMAQQVDQVGRVIVLTTHKERAELEKHRIHNFGSDPLISHCKGSMTAVIEPAQGS
jgi:ATP-dependent Clp protease adaptor protein ClpS